MSDLRTPRADAATSEVSADAEVLAWDLPTRLFKWGLVACVAAAWATNRFALEHPYWHVWNGIAVLVLLVFRALWGLVGGSTARFSAFVTSPPRALRYFAAQLRGVAPPYLGHTPIAAQMIVALLLVLAVQAGLGLYSADPDRLIVGGPLADTIGDATVQRISRLHRWGFDVVLVLASLHIAANAFYAVVSRKGYLQAMVTGRKVAAPYHDARSARPGSLTSAAVCLLAAFALVLGVIRLLGGTFAF